MAGYAAFLRAINVTGRRVSSADLCSALEDTGLRDVAAFRASGNLVFSADGGSRAKITSLIETRLKDALGYEVPVFLRSAAEVRAIAADQPFPARMLEASKGKLQVVMLAERPAKAAQATVLELATDDDRLAFGKRELYWLPSSGTQRSELDFKAIGELVGASTTVRTKGTVEQIAARFFGA
jgi:uncharacterized protein (DUF1697 family)